MTIHALPVDVFRSSKIGDCTNDGVSKFFPELLVYCPDGHREFDADKEIPLNFCMIRTRQLFGGRSKYVDIVPATIDESGKPIPRPGWWMYGGNIGSTSDSRFNRITGIDYPVKIFDRQEH